MSCRRFAPFVVAIVLTLLVLAPSRASAFCGFYVGGAGAKLFNDATVVVMMREGTRTVLSMQNAYKGPPEKFAMVVPVPVVLQEENVKTLKPEIFDHVDQLAAPRLVEYWEQDPCAPDALEGGGMSIGMRKESMASAAAVPMADSLGVKVEAQFAVGEYQIVVLSAQDSTGLETWLHRESYTIPEGAEPYFRPYVASGSKFFVAKVDVTKVKMENGVAQLSPLRFHYDSDEFRLPVRLGLVNSSGTQDLIVHLLARNSRYEVANYPNVTIPTNLDVSEAAGAEFGAFYTTLFDRTLERNPKAVVTEYAWAPTSCDPCPGPVLDNKDLAALGLDVLAKKESADAGAPDVSPWRGGGLAAMQMVLTRLHVRYTKDSLGEDLVFKVAPPIVGGREMRGADGKLENGAEKSSYNNFQARYAIRHSWQGPISCKDPKRGRWGGPPGEGNGHGAAVKAARKLGLAPRAKADLATYVKSDVPELDFKASGAGASGKKGCLGCTTTRGDDAVASGGALAAIGALVLVVRRRRRR
ncbi:MAG: DUF2330 domain-containing protein [Deltaproteobacteria bacterium]|nr:DUF2330 domain-containing protein [Deltaproteobacteria bacterium]